MKKFHVFALSAIVAVGTLAVSCQGGGNVTANASLKNEIDTLSYAYGVQIAESGLDQYLQQSGIYQDTALFRLAEMQRIGAEADAAKKAIMEKGLAARIDSLSKANTKNMELFAKGLQESVSNENKEKDAYYTGLQIGGQVKMMTENFEKQVLVDDDAKTNKAAFIAGMIAQVTKGKLAVEGASALVNAKAMASQEKVQKKQEEEAKKEFSSQIAAGDKFMTENKAKEGVVALPSGLQYKIVKAGNGAKPSATDRVSVYYKGSLIDGNVFETNEGKDIATFGVNQVIKGWTEALQLMPVGSKWTLYIPSDLAYGGQATGNIAPFSNLIFDIELVSINK